MGKAETATTLGADVDVVVDVHDAAGKRGRGVGCCAVDVGVAGAGSQALWGSRRESAMHRAPSTQTPPAAVAVAAAVVVVAVLQWGGGGPMTLTKMMGMWMEGCVSQAPAWGAAVVQSVQVSDGRMLKVEDWR